MQIKSKYLVWHVTIRFTINDSGFSKQVYLKGSHSQKAKFQFWDTNMHKIDRLIEIISF
jgi:hypothetical protein